MVIRKDLRLRHLFNTYISELLSEEAVFFPLAVLSVSPVLPIHAVLPMPGKLPVPAKLSSELSVSSEYVCQAISVLTLLHYCPFGQHHLTLLDKNSLNSYLGYPLEIDPPLPPVPVLPPPSPGCCVSVPAALFSRPPLPALAAPFPAVAVKTPAEGTARPSPTSACAGPVELLKSSQLLHQDWRQPHCCLHSLVSFRLERWQ